MIKNRRAIICFIVFLIIVSSITIVKASSFNFNAKAQKEIVNPGDEVIIDMDVSDIDAGKEGINAVEMFLEYDKNIFENMEFDKQNNWKVEYNDIQGHSKQGKVLFVKMTSGVNENQEIGKIKLKLKDNLGEMETEIKLKEITSNDGKELMPDGDRIIKIRIVKPQDGTQGKDKLEEENISMPKTGQQRIMYIALGFIIIACIIMLVYLKVKNKKIKNRK